MPTVPDDRKATVDRAPRLQAEECPEHPDGVCWRVWCEHCPTRARGRKKGRWHHHGAGTGARVAHCQAVDSPYVETGYVLLAPRGAA